MSIRQGGKIIAGNVSHYNVGDTFMTTRTDTSLAGAVECDGATYNTTDFTGTGSIGELLEAGKLDYISLSAYSTAIAQTGWCDKIGWDGAGTTAFRVPTLNAHIVQTNNIPVIGNGGRTNMYNTAGSTSDHHMALTSSGIVYLENVVNSALGFSTDPTKSGMIADTTDTAQLRVMIQIANGATDQALETCTGVLADVADLKDHRVIAFQAPTAENNYTWYRLYADGWVEQGGRTSNFTNTAQLTGESKTVTLPIAMSDTHYTANASMSSDLSLGNGSVSGYANRVIKTGDMTTTNFIIDEWALNGSTGTSVIACWQVSGMAAQ